MHEYEDTTYGDRIAGVYDDLYSEYDPGAIELLAELAGAGPALELGSGTGRIALPLLDRGVEVQGIDASEAMTAQLRSKPRGEEIEIVMGSFAEFKIDRHFQLIFVVFNTFFGLLTQEEQVSCFKSVGEHLTQGGFFLMEAFVPDLCRFIDNQTVRATTMTEEEVQLDVSQHDPVSQTVSSQHVLLSEEGTQIYPVKLRYAWPSELDLMAQLAGLELKHRWSSWSKDVFTQESSSHISVYGRG